MFRSSSRIFLETTSTASGASTRRRAAPASSSRRLRRRRALCTCSSARRRRSAPDSARRPGWIHRKALRQRGVEFLRGVTYKSVEDDGFRIEVAARSASST